MDSIDSIDSDEAKDSDEEPVILLKKRKFGSQEIQLPNSIKGDEGNIKSDKRFRNYPKYT